MKADKEKKGSPISRFMETVEKAVKPIEDIPLVYPEQPEKSRDLVKMPRMPMYRMQPIVRFIEGKYDNSQYLLQVRRKAFFGFDRWDTVFIDKSADEITGTEEELKKVIEHLENKSIWG